MTGGSGGNNGWGCSRSQEGRECQWLGPLTPTLSRKGRGSQAANGVEGAWLSPTLFRKGRAVGPRLTRPLHGSGPASCPPPRHAGLLCHSRQNPTLFSIYAQHDSGGLQNASGEGAMRSLSDKGMGLVLRFSVTATSYGAPPMLRYAYKFFMRAEKIDQRGKPVRRCCGGKAFVRRAGLRYRTRDGQGVRRRGHSRELSGICR